MKTDMTVNWISAQQITGQWYLSPDGEMCKATCLPDGSVLVVRSYKPGIWRGSTEDFRRLFRPFIEQQEPACAMA